MLPDTPYAENFQAEVTLTEKSHASRALEKPTPHGNAFADHPMAEAIATIAASLERRLRGMYRAILLTGAAARREYTVSPDGIITSDLDFLVVLPQRHAVSALLAERCSRRRLVGFDRETPTAFQENASVGFASSFMPYWHVATPFMWELKVSSGLCYGDAYVKQWPAITDATQIPEWEGIRLIANRVCELLGALGQWAADSARTAPGAPSGTENGLFQSSVEDLSLVREANVSYAAVKTAIACSEALLIKYGFYMPSYRERRRAHGQVAERFSSRHNILIEEAYVTKLGLEHTLFERATIELAREAISLALSTLSSLGVGTPSAIALASRRVSPAAPGVTSDLLYAAVMGCTGQRVPVRRPISAVYAYAVALASELTREDGSLTMPGSLRESGIAQRCNSLFERFKSCPQVVGVVSTQIREGARA